MSIPETPANPETGNKEPKKLSREMMFEGRTIELSRHNLALREQLETQNIQAMRTELRAEQEAWKQRVTAEFGVDFTKEYIDLNSGIVLPLGQLPRGALERQR
jgi:hypothetical protein